MVAALLLAASIEGRLAYWQVAQHESLSQRAALFQLQKRTLPATRGTISDRNGDPLAVETIVYDVTVTPASIAPERRAGATDRLAAALGLTTADVAAVLGSGKPFAYLARRQPQAVADRVAALHIGAVGLDPVAERRYFQGGTADVSLASNLLGFVTYDGKGEQGLEQRYDRQLAGRNGSILTYQDSSGNEIALGSQKRLSPVDGANLTLTLDGNIQYVAEQALADGVNASHAQGGSVVVMDSRTGGIVAWADYPAFDANRFPTEDPAHFRDSALSDLYEPGSVMKVVTLAGALDQGRISPSTIIDDPGYIQVSGQVLHDWDLSPHGSVTMTNVLERSLNVGAVRAEQAEGQDAFLHYLDAFGIGRSTGVDVSGETAARLRGSWRPVELATAAYGQGVAVNAVQMCAAVNVIANGGRWVQPHVVEKVGDSAVAPAPSRQVVSSQTAATMARMMESVVQHGSGYLARVPGFESNQAGKTGTSNMPDLVRGGYSPDHVWASYAGFLPADNPRFTMLVVIRQPNNGSADHNEGYYVAAPIWKRVAQEIVQQWRITSGPTPPSY
jgi:stage V sporulation protein D (sporulation-specific penicillin-binding protein)